MCQESSRLPFQCLLRPCLDNYSLVSPCPRPGNSGPSGPRGHGIVDHAEFNSEVVKLTRCSIGLDTMLQSMRFGLDCFLRPGACKGLHALTVLLCSVCFAGVSPSVGNCAVTLSLSCCGEINVFVFSRAIVKGDDASLISGARRAAVVRDLIKCHAVPAKRSDHPVT